jgi:oxygen-independent coproporphyrinogen-3 oxidase
VFIGGGTPSLFSPAAISELLDAVRARVRLKPALEVTLEANPGTVDAAHFQGYRTAGVTRLSIGAQSFDDGALKALGRIHDRAQICMAVAAARSAGFDRINLDLMYGLPGQTMAYAMSDLRQALALNPDHLSWYQLTIEPNTIFYSRPPQLPADGTIEKIERGGRKLLRAVGFRRYEISAYARPGARCAHNMNYWRFGDYLGIGAGAHGKLTGVRNARVVRYARHRLPEAYMRLAGGPEAIADRRELTPADLKFEFMLNALRLTAGFAPSWFARHTGLPLSSVAAPLRAAEERGLLVHRPDRIRPTALGRRFLNDLLQLFM